MKRILGNICILFIMAIIIIGQFFIAELFFFHAYIGILLFLLLISPFLCERIPSFTLKKYLHKIAYLYMGSQVVLLPMVFFHFFIKHLPLYSYLIVVIYIGIGIINASRIIVKEYHIKSTIQSNIGLISDVHLGYQIGKKQLLKMIDIINLQNIEYLVIAGDLCDMNLDIIMQQNLFPLLDNIKVPVYLALGNHDNYTRKVDELKQALSHTKVKVLDDEAIIIKDTYLIGRNDAQFSNHSLDNFQSDLYKIVIDHTPSRIQESIDHQIDLHLSGHTHNGQLFPFQLITNAIFKVGYGYQKFGNTNVIVSGGIGYWGPMNKTTCSCEIVVIYLEEN